MLFSLIFFFLLLLKPGDHSACLPLAFVKICRYNETNTLLYALEKNRGEAYDFWLESFAGNR